ncbi:hypothetical protein [Streptomyces genisteinicus]|nr:hypothetical protein [Streptomyces genisteinicus]
MEDPKAEVPNNRPQRPPYWPVLLISWGAAVLPVLIQEVLRYVR